MRYVGAIGSVSIDTLDFWPLLADGLVSNSQRAC